MTLESNDLTRIFPRLTTHRASILRELADGRTLRESAKALDLSYAAIRSAVAELKLIIGVSSCRSLGNWWRENRLGWIEFAAGAGGVQLKYPKDPT